MYSSDFRGKNKMIASDFNAELLLPIEIMFEIFSWLTVASLLRCKSVCKRWNEIIQHPKFIEMQMMRGSETIFYYTSVDGTAATFTILASCRGLLVEKSKISGMYRVRNPATKQILALPDPQDEVLVFMSMIFLPFTNSYKLVSIFYSENKIGRWGCKVLSLGDSDLSWRALEDSYLHELDRRRQKISFSLDNAFLYCVGLSMDGSSDSHILCLNMETEIFTGSRPLSVPKSFFPNWKKVRPMKWDKKVALGSIVEQELHVWVLEDLIQAEWAKEKIIIPLTFLKENPDMKETLVPSFASYESVSFIKAGNLQAIVFCIKSQKVLKSQSAPPGKIIRCCLRSSLVTLKGMQPDNEEQTDEVGESFAKVIRAS